MLRGADFLDADLHYARFDDAVYDDHTRWPSGFDPKQYGAVKHP
jgi:hypothetical protein